MSQRKLRVGLISDTHGVLRPQALEYLRGSDFIVHAGDIGNGSILDALEKLAAVTAVRGNNDNGPWAAALPESNALRAADVRIYVVHDLKCIDFDVAAAGFRVVVSGHSHKPVVREQEGVLYVNPGSAGPRRFSLPISVGELLIRGNIIDARLFTLPVGAAP